MKKSIKYITLVFGSIAFAFFFLLATSLLLDIKNLEHPASLILPEVMFVLLLTALIFLIIWGFKFSNNKPHKLHLIFMSICLSLTVLFFILSKIINPIITSTTSSSLPKNYINVESYTDTLKYLSSTKGYNVLNMSEVEGTDKPENIKSFSFSTGTENSFHISVVYNKDTQGVTSVSMFRDKNSSVDEFANMILIMIVSLNKDIDTETFIDRSHLATLKEDTSVLTEFEIFDYFYSVNDSFRNVYLTIN